MGRDRRLVLVTVLSLPLALSACGSRTSFSGLAATGAQTPQAGTSPGASSPTTDAATPTTDAATPAATPGASGSRAPATSPTPVEPVPNTASDVGVTATTITVGSIVSKSGALGPDALTPFSYGATAYFADLNARGGIHGRTVAFRTCDDNTDAGGNQTCARQLVDTDHVFALVATTCLFCDGLDYVSSKKVPAVGGNALDLRDLSLPHSWRYDGNPYPQDGSVGYRGRLYEGTQQYRFFATRYGVKKAGVVYSSFGTAAKNEALAALEGLRAEGVEATGYPVSVTYDKAVAEMKSQGVTAVWDLTGSSGLCRSVDTQGLVLTALVSPLSRFGRAAVEQLSAPCRTYLFDVQDPGEASYDQTGDPEVARFRASVRQHFPGREPLLAQGYLDGWASAMWFADAAASCGARLTRVCLEASLDRPGGYAAHGLWWPRGNDKVDFARTRTVRRCIQVTQWSERAKAFVVRGAYRSTCWTTPYVSYPAPS